MLPSQMQHGWSTLKEDGASEEFYVLTVYSDAIRHQKAPNELQCTRISILWRPLLRAFPQIKTTPEIVLTGENSATS